MNKNEQKGTSSGVAYALGMLSYNMEYTIIAQLNYALTDSYSFSAIALPGMLSIIFVLFIPKIVEKFGKKTLCEWGYAPQRRPAC